MNKDRDSDAITQTGANPLILSDFSNYCLEHGTGSLEMHKNLRNTYSEDYNPQGVINLAVAENTLMHKELADYFAKAFRLKGLDFTYGDGLTGTLRLSKALSGFLNSHFHAYRTVEPEHILLGNGLMTVLSQVGRAIANRGDGILIATPYYLGFDISFTLQHGLKIIQAPMTEKDVGTMNELTILEKTLLESNAAGTSVKAVVLCNPHNPLGRCYPKEVIEGYCRLCEKYNLFLLSDEIFAMSTFVSSDHPNMPSFISALSIDVDRIGVNPARILVLYSMSKDFNANGFRAGALVAQSNPDLIHALTITNYFAIVASPTDALWSAMLNNASVLESFFATNRAKLGEAYEYATKWLKYHELPYIPCHATHFILVDLRPVLSNVQRYGPLLGIKQKDSMQERELSLSRYVLSKGVLLSPGLSHHVVEGGWIRLSFSVRRDYINIAFRRIEEAMGWGKWPELRESRDLSSL